MNPHENLSLSEAILGLLFLSLTVYNISKTPRETAWWYINTFCLFRTTGSALLLAIALKRDYTHESLLIPAIIFSGIAISPLLAACLGFLNSCTQHLPGPRHPIIRLLYIAHLLVIVALILNIVGGTTMPYHSASSSASVIDSLNKAITYIRASSIVSLMAWVLILVSLIILFPHRKAFERTARAFYIGVLGSMPFLFVRILYAILAAWDLKKGVVVMVPGGASRYGLINGDVGVLVGMRVFMEFLVVGGWNIMGIAEGRWGGVKGENGVEEGDGA